MLANDGGKWRFYLVSVRASVLGKRAHAERRKQTTNPVHAEIPRVPRGEWCLVSIATHKLARFKEDEIK